MYSTTPDGICQVCHISIIQYVWRIMTRHIPLYPLHATAPFSVNFWDSACRHSEYFWYSVTSYSDYFWDSVCSHSTVIIFETVCVQLLGLFWDSV